MNVHTLFLWLLKIIFYYDLIKYFNIQIIFTKKKKKLHKNINRHNYNLSHIIYSKNKKFTFSKTDATVLIQHKKYFNTKSIIVCIAK
jgi:hypothetical protein